MIPNSGEFNGAADGEFGRAIGDRAGEATEDELEVVSREREQKEFPVRSLMAEEFLR